MLLECSCGKMYRVRDGTVAAPTKCPACGGQLRAAGGGAAPAAAATAGADPKVKDLESRLHEMERELSARKADAELKAKEAVEAQTSIARLGEEQARDKAAYKDALTKKELEIESNHQKIAQLEADLEKSRSQTATRGAPAGQIAVLKQKDVQIQELQEKVSSLEEQLSGKRGGGGSDRRIAELERELEDSRQNVPHLADELSREKSAYRETLLSKEREIDDLHGKFAAMERQLIEQSSRAQAGSPGGEAAAARADAEQKAGELQKAQSRIAQLEKICQDGERRYRQIQEEMEKSTQAAMGGTDEGAKLLAEKDQTIASMNNAVTEQRLRAEQLAQKIKEIEAAAAKAERELTRSRMKTATAPAAPLASGKLDEARYLAGDLGKSLASVSSQLSALVERVKRLHESLDRADTPEPPASQPSSWGGAPASEPEPEPALPAVGSPNISLRIDDYANAPDEPDPEADTPVPGRNEPEEEIAQLEGLPEPVPEDDGGLPADETLLDMGKLGKQVRIDLEQRRAAAAAREAEAVQEEPVAEAVPVDDPEPQPKKRGFFGKLFGKKE